MRPIRTLKEYESRYKHYKRKLLRFTKKEVEDFDKAADTVGEHYVLKHRKWVLLGDTYYEIPKPIRLTWFKGLSAAGKLGACSVLVGSAGVIGGGAYGIYALMNRNAVIDASLDSSLSDFLKIENIKKDSNGDTLITIKVTKAIPEGFNGLSVYKGDQLLVQGEEYGIDGDESGCVVTISKAAMDKYPGKVIIKEKQSPGPEEGKVTKEQWEYALNYLVADDRNYHFTVMDYDINKSSEYSIYDQGKNTRYCDLDAQHQETGDFAFEVFNELDGAIYDLNKNGVIQRVCSKDNVDSTSQYYIHKLYDNLLSVYDDENLKFDTTTKSYSYSVKVIEPGVGEVTTNYTIKFNSDYLVKSFTYEMVGEEAFKVDIDNYEGVSFLIPSKQNYYTPTAATGTEVFSEEISYANDTECTFVFDVSQMTRPGKTIFTLVDSSDTPYLADTSFQIFIDGLKVDSSDLTFENKSVSFNNDITGSKILTFAKMTANIQEPSINLKAKLTTNNQ